MTPTSDQIGKEYRKESEKGALRQVEKRRERQHGKMPREGQKGGERRVCVLATLPIGRWIAQGAGGDVTLPASFLCSLKRHKAHLPENPHRLSFPRGLALWACLLASLR